MVTTQLAANAALKNITKARLVIEGLGKFLRSNGVARTKQDGCSVATVMAALAEYEVFLQELAVRLQIISISPDQSSVEAAMKSLRVLSSLLNRDPMFGARVSQSEKVNISDEPGPLYRSARRINKAKGVLAGTLTKILRNLNYNAIRQSCLLSLLLPHALRHSAARDIQRLPTACLGNRSKTENLASSGLIFFRSFTEAA
ncbi:hypothetical protein FMUND_13508 [Fusarium mundagurra]|uniref:Uncharacterized protein n=1 Tax=Fusarium mundagurra TaxID=1567541 RepID=A0A8H5XYJ8_9HYPO|nr:hypothetical protein FMUND_13508 [Fusarium mundagurra]